MDWYDLLDVPRDADTGTIRAAWKAAVADLDPGDKTFKVYSHAAEVLLDPARRAAYDESLADEESAEEPAAEEPAAEEPAAEEPAAEEPVADQTAGGVADGGTHAVAATSVHERAEPEAAPTSDGSGSVVAAVTRWQPPLWLLIGLAAVTALVLALGLVLRATVSSDDDIAEASTSAQGTAEKAVVDVLAFDHRDLKGSHDDAVAWMTEDYREDKYEPLFSVIEANAGEVKPVVTVRVVGSAVTRSSEDRAHILLFVNRETSNKKTAKPVTTYDQATLVMERSGDTWLVDDIVTSDSAG